MDLVDALSSNTTAQSVVELSLNPAFRRGYSALYKAVAKAELAGTPKRHHFLKVCVTFT